MQLVGVEDAEDGEDPLAVGVDRGGADQPPALVGQVADLTVDKCQLVDPARPLPGYPGQQARDPLRPAHDPAQCPHLAAAVGDVGRVRGKDAQEDGLVARVRGSEELADEAAPVGLGDGVARPVLAHALAGIHYYPNYGISFDYTPYFFSYVIKGNIIYTWCTDGF